MVESRRGAARRALLPGLVAAGLLGGPALAADQALPPPAAGEVRLSDPAPDGGGLALVARVPDWLSGMQLDAAAFSARQGDRSLAVVVERVLTSTAQVVLALDTGVGREGLLAEQSAAADLLRTLPPDVATVLVPGGTGGTARDAFSRLGALEPGPAPLLEGLGEPPPGHRLVVLLTGCAALRAAAPDVPATLARLGPDAEVHVLVLDAGCEQLAADLAAPSGGVARTGLDAGRLLAGVDAVSREVGGTYRLRLDADPSGAPVVVRTVGASTVAEGQIDLAAGSSTPPSGSGSGPATGRGPAGSSAADPLPTGPVVAAGTLLAVLAVAVALALRAPRRPA